ncbi:TetR/AcrR family transcriptional regulator [Sciscionella sediminilitoris]|uniref:TetR/AcrR family transcriptional regulator n=1 Tax=Sciscionella sediminilitoris TaxID=1445613 RepID=UPI0005618E99|nr:TetR/AcrR family transcriptional regulator [Sciscionella sp. SE31]
MTVRGASDQLADPGAPRAKTSPGGGTRRRAETRRRLMDAAYEVFTEHSIRDAPIELICERAGFTRGAFYSNFGSKEDLFLAVFEEHMRTQVDNLRSTLSEVLGDAELRDLTSLREAIGRVSAVYLEPLVTDKSWHLMTIEFKAIALRDPQLRAGFRDMMNQLDSQLSEVLATLFTKVGVELAMPVEDVASVLATLYETAAERVMFEGELTPMESPFITQVLPRLLTAALITPPQ